VVLPTRSLERAAALVAPVMERGQELVPVRGLAHRLLCCELVLHRLAISKEGLLQQAPQQGQRHVEVQLVIATDHRLVREEERHWAAKPTRWKALAAEPAALGMVKALVRGPVRGLDRVKEEVKERVLAPKLPVLLKH